MREWIGTLPPFECYLPPGRLFPLPPPDGFPVVLGPLPPLTPPPLPPPPPFEPPLLTVSIFPLILVIIKRRVWRLLSLYGLMGKNLAFKITGGNKEGKGVSEYLEESPFASPAVQAKVLRCFASGSVPAKGCRGEPERGARKNSQVFGASYF